MDRGPLTVEFVGLPGAGKTTMADRISAELEGRGWRCAGRLPLLGEDLGGLERAVRRTATLLRGWHRTGAALSYLVSTRTRSRVGAHWALRLSTWPLQWQAARRAGVDYVILDWGLLQNTWATTIGGRFGDGTASSRLLRRLLGTGAPRYAIVYFDIDVEGSLARIGQRNNRGWRFDGMEVERARRLLTIHRPHMERLVEQAVELTGAPLCRVDAHRPIEENTRQILRFIESIDPQASEPRRLSA